MCRHIHSGVPCFLGPPWVLITVNMPPRSGSNIETPGNAKAVSRQNLNVDAVQKVNDLISSPPLQDRSKGERSDLLPSFTRSREGKRMQRGSRP